MMVFYVLSMLDISSRITFLVASCYYHQLARELFLISSFSTVATISAGVSHSQNLSRLIIDLAAVKCQSVNAFKHLMGKKIYFKLALAAWVLIIALYAIAVLIPD